MRGLRDRHRREAARSASLHISSASATTSSVHGGLAVHLRDARLALGDLHLDAKLIARPHRTAELRLLDGRQQHQLVLAIRHATSAPARPPLAPSLPPPARPASPGNSGKWPTKKGSFTVTFLIPTMRSSSSSRIESTSSIGIAMRQNIANFLDVEKGHANWLL